MMNKYHFVGKLILTPSIMTKMDYGMVCPTSRDILFHDVTDILEEILKSNSPFISVHIKSTDGSFEFIHTGKLNINKDKYGVNDFCVDQFTLGLDLFNNTNKKLNINIEHLKEKEIKYKKVSEEAS